MTNGAARSRAGRVVSRASLGALALAVALLAPACRRSNASTAPQAGDASASGRSRLVSVGSAVTETIFALGAGAEVVAVDSSSLFPDDTARLPKVGYQRSLSAEGILGLKPGLLLATGEAGPSDVVAQLRAAGLRVESFPVDSTVAGARERITSIAKAVGRDPRPVLARLDEDLERARQLVSKTSARPRVLAIYARGPQSLHVFGKHTAATTMVELAGGTNAITAFEGAKPLTPEAIVEAAPDVILVPSRGLESVGGERAILDLPGVSATAAGENARIITLDDLLLLGMGPRTGAGVLELCRKLHPELPKEGP